MLRSSVEAVKRVVSGVGNGPADRRDFAGLDFVTNGAGGVQRSYSVAVARPKPAAHAWPRNVTP